MERVELVVEWSTVVDSHLEEDPGEGMSSLVVLMSSFLDSREEAEVENKC